MIELSLILPVHNEEDIIEQVLDDIEKKINNLKIRHEIILVENGSSDKTPQIIKSLSKSRKYVVPAVSLKGYGNAVIKGLQLSKGKYVCYMPSDGQVDMEIFPVLWEEAISGKFNLVKVKRGKRESWLRDFTSWSFSLIMKIVFGTLWIDTNGSPRIFKREYLEKMNLQSGDSFIDGEFLIKMSKLGWSIEEISMKNLDRAGGSSTRSIHTYTEFIKNIYKFRTGNYLSRWEREVNN
ncbi:MAG: hypothetical protein A2857_05180 [Candidatus Levybacteria bacterium RIFCSPHIGHO2_01_FULL_36_15]|nr:MAG: hypothetical protein A2857_05180 [Candidatus Levybacteria bacterium RIFCSPHIGHO2_01_FULL_36_15]OGH38451.1 MAG: hypothetical protein A2905_01430 [Candidatus Levybacteria bacterium RIFCSPLOWO2_01_FULL_36_10]